MTLTPEDVRKKTFTPVRLREGYDMGEVDQFLDEVEVELTRLLEEKGDGPPSQPDGAAATTSVGADAGVSPGTSAPVSTPDRPVVRTIPEASNAAARLLEIATQNADQLVFEAHEDADRIIGEATVKAERLESESRAKAERLEAEAETRAERLDEETAKRREEVLGGLEQDKQSLTSELEDLRAFEREYRSRLRGYFESQLRTLDGEVGTADSLEPSSDDEVSPGLQALLAEDPHE